MKTRIISAAVALVLLTAALCLHSTVIFNVLISLLSGLMIFELFRAFKEHKRIIFLCSSIIMAVALAILPRFILFTKDPVIYLIVVLLYVVISSVLLLKEHNEIDLGVFFSLLFYSLLIGSAMSALATIESSDQEFGLQNIILTFCGAWLADTGAYFAGTFFGKHKLCPEISPKKTVEGFIGGVVSNALIMMLAGFIMSCFMDGVEVRYVYLAILGVITSALGLVGDLMASLIKRTTGIKDYGNIMPGHGGALDRFDSVLYVAPAMAICLSYISLFTR